MERVPAICLRLCCTLIALLLLIHISGCRRGAENPQTQFYPVRGRAYLGEKPILGGTIRFQRVDSSLVVEGTIRPDGTFFLATKSAKDTAVLGVPEGEYAALYQLDTTVEDWANALCASQKVFVDKKDNVVTLQFKSGSETEEGKSGEVKKGVPVRVRRRD